MKKNDDEKFSRRNEKCQWNDSSIGISGINFPENADTTKKQLEAEMLNNLAVIDQSIIIKPLLAKTVLNDFLVNYSARVGIDYRFHATKVISFYRVALENTLDKPFEECLATEILSEDVVNSVCNQLFKCKSTGKYKSIAKQIITHIYGASPTLLMLDPQYNKLINIITYWNKKVTPLVDKRVTIDPDKDHEFLGKFLDFQYSENRKTQANDKRGVRFFLQWLASHIPCFSGIHPKDIDVQKITIEHISLYEQYQEGRITNKDISRGYCGSVLFQPIKRWFNYLHSKKNIFVNPCSNWKFKWERTKRKPTLPSEEQVKTLLKTIYIHSINPLMDIALFGLYILTGLRSISALGNNVKDFNAKNGTLKVTLKGGDEHLQKLHPFNVIQMERYLDTRVFNSSNPGDEPLWLNRLNRPVSRECVTRKLHKYMQLAGLEAKDGPHLLRHLFISEAANSGKSLKEIADMIGAKSAAEIEPYLHSRKKEMFDKLKANYPNLKTLKEYDENETKFAKKCGF